MHALKRGGDHVMFMGLTRSLEHGDMIEVTLTFEHAGDVTMTVPIDLERQDKMSAHTHSD
jgi:copper(I)-binding protein